LGGDDIVVGEVARGGLLWSVSFYGVYPRTPPPIFRLSLCGNDQTEKANEILTQESLLEDVVDGRQASLRAPSARLRCGGLEWRGSVARLAIKLHGRQQQQEIKLSFLFAVRGS
jgi:hypothetical protein